MKILYCYFQQTCCLVQCDNMKGYAVRDAHLLPNNKKHHASNFGILNSTLIPIRSSYFIHKKSYSIENAAKIASLFLKLTKNCVKLGVRLIAMWLNKWSAILFSTTKCVNFDRCYQPTFLWKQFMSTMDKCW